MENTKEYLEALVLDREKLDNKITETNGFILEEIKSNNINIDVSILTENINVFSVKFLKENYSLDENILEKIDILLADSSKSTVNNVLSEEEIKRFLLKEKLLPTSTVLGLEHFNNFRREINKQFDIDEWRTERIIVNSFKRLSFEEIKSVDKTFLLDNISALSYRKDLFNSNEFKKFYVDLVFTAYDKPNIQLFKNFIFGTEDKDLLLKLLKNTNDNRYSFKSYSDIENIDGVKSLISKFEYHKLYKIKSLEDFSIGEIQNNKEFFQELWAEKDGSVLSGYHFFDDLLRVKSTAEQFEEIITKDYLIELLKKAKLNGSLFGNVDKDYNDVNSKKLHLMDVILEAYVDNKKIDESLKFQDIMPLDLLFHSVRDVVGEDGFNVPQKRIVILNKINENLRVIYDTVINKSMVNSDVANIIKSMDYIFDPVLIKTYYDFFDKNPSINTMYILFKLVSDNEKRHFYQGSKHDFLEKAVSLIDSTFNSLVTKEKDSKIKIENFKFINKVFASINNELGQEYLKEKITENPSLSVSNIELTDDIKTRISKNNIFAFEILDIKNLNRAELDLISSVRPEFFEKINKDKIFVSEGFIYTCLNMIDKSPYMLPFLNKYVELHRSEIEKSPELMKRFLANKYQQTLFPISDTSLFDNDYIKLKFLCEKSLVCEEKRSFVANLFNNKELPYSRQELKVKDIDIEKFDENIIIENNMSLSEAKLLHADLYQKHSAIGKEIRQYKDSLPFGYLSQKVDRLLKDNNFKEISFLIKNNIDFDSNLFVNYVNNLTFDSLMKNLKSDDFLNLLKKELDYDKKTDIKFGKFTKEENILLSNQLLEKYQNESKKYDFLFFFDKENNSFIKEFAIKNFPKEVIYGYDFLPNDKNSYRPTFFVMENYTNEEIYSTYKNLVVGHGFFSETDVNADFKNFFCSTLFPEKKENKSGAMDRFKSFLNFIKEKDAMLYSLMSNEIIISQGVDYGKSSENPETENMTRYEAIAYHANKLFDFKKTIKGLSDFIDLTIKHEPSNEGEARFNSDLSSGCITSFIYSTYFEVNDPNTGRTNEYRSFMSEENTIELMKLLFEKSPQHLIDRHTIGCANNTADFFRKNINNFYSQKNVENFIFPNPKIQCKYLRLDEDSEAKERLINFALAIISHATEIKDVKMIEYFNHLIKQQKFAEDNLSWEAQSKLHKGKSSMFIEVLAKDDRIIQSLQNTKLKIDLDKSLSEKEFKRPKAKKI